MILIDLTRNKNPTFFVDSSGLACVMQGFKGQDVTDDFLERFVTKMKDFLRMKASRLIKWCSPSVAC